MTHISLKKSLLPALLFCAITLAHADPYNLWSGSNGDIGYLSQGMLGIWHVDKFQMVDSSGSGVPLEVDYSTLPRLGGSWSTIPQYQPVQIGLECSLMTSFRIDKINYIEAGGSGLKINLSTSLWTLDASGGPYVNFFLGDTTRFYVAGGPMLIYAWYWADRTETVGISDTETDNSATAFGGGAYARCGLEFEAFPMGYIGLSARGTWFYLNFSDLDQDRASLGGIAGFVTFTAGF